MLPYIHYLKYLVTARKTQEEIIAELGELGFEVDSNEISSIERTMMLPPIFKQIAEGKSVAGHERFILKYAAMFNIKDAWRYQLYGKPREFAEALQLVKDKDSRLIPVVLSIKGAPEALEALQILGKPYSPKAVELFLHYFFNTKIINIVGWRNFFDRYDSQVKEVLNQPLDYIRHKLGLKPDLEYVEILRDFMYLGYYKAKEYFEVGTQQFVNMGKTMSELALKAGEKYHQYSRGDTKSFLEDVKLGFKESNIPLPDIETIKGDEEGKPLTLI